ncbi:MAG TPA: glycogen synthase [Desulfobulbaceae bacterium]|nr:glycogen synthase [Desulfobulbaceae bacterium]
MVSREYDGLAGAGGVKDVCRQLAEVLAAEAGMDVTVVLPRYGFMDAAQSGFSPLPLTNGSHVDICGGRSRRDCILAMDYPDKERRETVSFWRQRRKGVRVILVESVRFAEKLGVYTYTAREEEAESWKKKGSGHYDYFAMNILLQKAALAVMIHLGERPDVIHCHDGHAATLAALMRELPGHRHYFSRSGTVVTIHNAGIGYHQEIADIPFARAVTGLPASVIEDGMLGQRFDPFVAASGYAVINTVSENYARELQETEDDARTGWLGHHLLKRGVRLAGVTNGINPEDFNPEQAERLGLAAPFNPRDDLTGKRHCKEDLLSACNGGTRWQNVEQVGSLLVEPDLPLFTFIGRMSAQKGVDVLAGSLDVLPSEARLQLLILGSGDPKLEDAVTKLVTGVDERCRVCYLRGYDPLLANRIYAAGDFFLIPSLYEPCGLTDYIAQLMGNLPIVHLVGGLVKVQDGKTGFGYAEHSAAALASTMERAMSIFTHDRKRIRSMQRAAVECIYSHHTWKQAMAGYLDLYEQARIMACRS